MIMAGSASDRHIRVVNLLDDMSLGGVTRALAVFDTPPVAEIADCTTVGVPFGSIVPPLCQADVLIIHFTFNWRRLVFLALLRLRHPRARIVLVEHSYTRAWEALFIRARLRFRTMLRIAYRLVDRVVSVSGAQADWIAEVAAIPRDRITIIHPHFTNPGLECLPLPRPMADRPLQIGAYGRFSEQKGYDTLISTFRAGHFPGCELIMGGFGEQEQLLHDLAGDCPHIRFVGRVSDVSAFLAGCDVVVMPSRWEAYGMVAMESREAGRPLLVSPVDGLPEHALPPPGDPQDRCGVVFDFNDPAAIAAALAQLTPDTLSAMAQAARRTATGSGERTRRNWAALISALATPTPHSAAPATMPATA